ncbi:hypothetical protein [Streptomyces sp. 7N604]|uniref:hypothetical protein n=1 Tax=Streptomyces sp. 7N604 TaxID=3457415 RepID=UPI003FD4916E
MNKPNQALQQAIRAAGCSYAELAREVRTVAAESGRTRLRTNSSAVSHWVSGTRPNDVTSAFLAEALSRKLGRPVTAEQLGLGTRGEAPDGREPAVASGPAGDPADALTRLGRADIERRTAVTSAAYSVAAAALPLGCADELAARGRSAALGSGTAGTGEIEAVKDMTRLFTAIDERYGGQHGRSAVVQYLVSDVAALCRARFRTENQRREMLSAAASLAYLAGWKAYDAGEMGLAQRYYLQAYRLTQEADNELHGAFILRILAHHGLEAGRPEHTLALIDAALDRVKGRTDPATESLYVITRARALAAEGIRREAVAESARAARMVEGADESEMPYWAALWGSAAACVEAHTAKAAVSLGEFAAAERHFSRAVWSRSGSEYQRIAALSVAHEGSMQCRQGRLEQACDTWARALDMMTGVRSARVRGAVADMSEDLGPLMRRGARTALDFDERVRAWWRDGRA